MAEKKQSTVPAGPDKVTLSYNDLVEKFEEERQKLASYDQRRTNVQSVINEAQAALTALEAIEKAEKGEKVLVPVGSGVYIQTAVDDQKNVKTSLIGDVVLDATIAEAKKTLAQRIQEFVKSFDKLVMHEQQTVRNLQSMERVIRRIGQDRQTAAANKPAAGQKAPSAAPAKTGSPKA